MLIGERLRELRLFLGLTQAEMCQGIISESFYSRVERGTRKISIFDLLAILNKNGLHLEDFFNEEAANKEPNSDNASKTRKLAKIAIRYLELFYQRGLITEAKQVIKLIEGFPPYPLLAFDKLTAQYYRALIEEDSVKVEQIRELVELAGEKITHGNL